MHFVYVLHYVLNLHCSLHYVLHDALHYVYVLHYVLHCAPAVCTIYYPLSFPLLAFTLACGALPIALCTMRCSIRCTRFSLRCNDVLYVMQNVVNLIHAIALNSITLTNLCLCDKTIEQSTMSHCTKCLWTSLQYDDK